MIKLIERDGRPFLVVKVKVNRVAAPLEVYADLPRTPAKRFTELLGYLVAQAHQDGMSAISIGADLDKGTMWLRYHGPRDTESPAWWDMIPPPLECYAALVRAIITATTFDSGPLGLGTLRASVNGCHIAIRVTLRTWLDVELRW